MQGEGIVSVSQLALPPGFRFFPTDEELLVHYLCRKVAGQHFSFQLIGEVDLYKFDPWVLPGKALFGEKEWYFFSPRDRKYPNGFRPNRVAGSGYWKATGTDKVITVNGRKVGIKKALVFYVGKAPRGTKTNWIMHEYRLTDPVAARKKGSRKLDEWVLCRIYKKSSGLEKTAASCPDKKGSSDVSSTQCSNLEDMLESLPEINDPFFSLPRMNSWRSSLQDIDQKQNLYSAARAPGFAGTSNSEVLAHSFAVVPYMYQIGESPSDLLGRSSIEEEAESAPQSQHLALDSSNFFFLQQQEQQQSLAASNPFLPDSSFLGAYPVAAGVGNRFW